MIDSFFVQRDGSVQVQRLSQDFCEGPFGLLVAPDAEEVASSGMLGKHDLDADVVMWSPC